MPESICFRYEFQLTRDQLQEEPFALAVMSKGLAVRTWINGHEVKSQVPENPKKKPKLDQLQVSLDSSTLRAGSNLLAIELSPPAPVNSRHFTPKYNQPVLSVRLDALPEAGELAIATAGEDVDIEVELVKQLAVVCDLCSSQANQRPACVDQCPHEAAIRVDSRFEFPVN